MQIEKLWRQSINYTQRLHNLVQRPRHQLFPSVYDLLDLVRHTSQNSNFHISALLYQVIVVHT